MLDKESDARMIGYGSMLIEGLVGVVALLSTCSLFPGDYFSINLSPEKFQAFQAATGISAMNLQQLCAAVGENVAGRPGGAVSLAVGFAQIFAGFPGLQHLMGYFYHFMIMFEALFILTTIDAGTRIARFLVQEFVGRFWKPFENPNWVPASLVSTGVVVYLWGYFIWNGSVSTVWPMFGTANQLLASVALMAATSAIINAGKARYAWVSFIPMLFVVTTTLFACWLNITENYLPLARNKPDQAGSAYVMAAFTVIIMVCAVVVMWESFRRWYLILVKKQHPQAILDKDHHEHEWPEYGCC
jgi:carbon starvation protein